MKKANDKMISTGDRSKTTKTNTFKKQYSAVLPDGQQKDQISS